MNEKELTDLFRAKYACPVFSIDYIRGKLFNRPKKPKRIDKMNLFKKQKSNVPTEEPKEYAKIHTRLVCSGCGNSLEVSRKRDMKDVYNYYVSSRLVDLHVEIEPCRVCIEKASNAVASIRESAKILEKLAESVRGIQPEQEQE